MRSRAGQGSDRAPFTGIFGQGSAYLAVAIDMLERLAEEADALTASGDPAALFTLLARMMTAGAENVAVKSALTAAEFDLRTAAPDVAAELTRQVAGLLARAQAAGVARPDVGAGEVMALEAGLFTAIRHAGAETSAARSAHLAGTGCASTGAGAAAGCGAS